jgi:hypothetical protein
LVTILQNLALAHRMFLPAAEASVNQLTSVPLSL